MFCKETIYALRQISVLRDLLQFEMWSWRTIVFFLFCFEFLICLHDIGSQLKFSNDYSVASNKEFLSMFRGIKYELKDVNAYLFEMLKEMRNKPKAEPAQTPETPFPAEPAQTPETPFPYCSFGQQRLDNGRQIKCIWNCF
jgi:hypothetical protein